MIPRKAAAPHLHIHAGIRPASAFRRLPAPTDNYERLRIGEIFSTIGIIGLRLTERARALQGTPVVIRGYMAPPLVEQGRNFVLTRAPLQTCPFCDDGARWPDDALPIHLDRDTHFVEPSHQIEVTGELEILDRMEAEALGLRFVRLVNARWQPL
jgi:hypothetical protein